MADEAVLGLALCFPFLSSHSASTMNRLIGWRGGKEGWTYHDDDAKTGLSARGRAHFFSFCESGVIGSTIFSSIRDSSTVADRRWSHQNQPPHHQDNLIILKGWRLGVRISLHHHNLFSLETGPLRA
ncbi:hypothetical protein GE09DRAFT_82705 [Coniochaeta sp. 2T2.1]|nr:hypothetical protein GE09DRAFT_82705 [Coniochaeta sp. 2T2.1]